MIHFMIKSPAAITIHMWVWLIAKTTPTIIKTCITIIFYSYHYIVYAQGLNFTWLQVHSCCAFATSGRFAAALMSSLQALATSGIVVRMNFHPWTTPNHLVMGYPVLIVYKLSKCQPVILHVSHVEVVRPVCVMDPSYLYSCWRNVFQRSVLFAKEILVCRASFTESNILVVIQNTPTVESERLLNP